MRYILLAVIAVAFGNLEAQKSLSLMPWPASIEKADGQFRIDQSFRVSIEGPGSQDFHEYAIRFISRIGRRTGIFLLNNIPEQGSGGNFKIIYEENIKLSVDVDESYNLAINNQGVTLISKTQIGAMRGLETLLQLLSSSKNGYYFPAYKITDEPRYSWRGLLLDICRHWMPLDVVLRNLDAMAAVKMNVLHLHITEDQGFRIESKVYPKLHEMGSDGQYFTQEEVKYIIAYATARGIRIVPEFDIPGHTTSWFVGHPELASSPGPYAIERKFGVHNPAMDPTKEYTYEFLEKFLTEMAGLFPDEYVHIGGDENNGKQWDTNDDIRKFKEVKAFDSNHELQTYFNGRISDILSNLDKRMVGWDEIADEDLPKSIVIQSCRGKQALIDAAEAGYDVLLSNGYYIDLVQPASYHYLNDPIPTDIDLSAEARSHILGGEATMWTELVSPETVDSRIWPRTAAIAERLWSPVTVNDVTDMYRRIEKISIQLEDLGLLHIKNQEMMMRRMAGEDNFTALKALIDVIEPIEGYKRHRYKKYTIYSSLTRIPDIAQPESFYASKFNLKVNEYAKSKDIALKKEIKDQLLFWVENHNKIKVLAQTNSQIREILPVSDDLSRISILGLQALSDNVSHDKSWKKSADEMLKLAAEPQIEIELKVVDGIRKLITNAK
jgi:hexosaminidase